MPRNLLLLAALGLLAGCQSVPPSADSGLAIVLDRALEIPAGSATVRLQDGRIVAMNAVQDVDPYCIFELDTVRDAPQPVRTGRFEVVAVQQRVQDFSGMPMMPMGSVSGGLSGDDGPSQMYYVTEFRLRSADDPRVRSLRCESNQVSIPAPAQHFLSLPEMRQAVGRYFSFQTTR